MSDTPERLKLAPVGLWTPALDVLPASQLKEQAAELEELGYGAIWTGEVAGRDPFVTHTLILSSTKKMVGATGIANIWGRDPITMVGGAKALTEAFPERFILGLGVSHKNLVSDLRGHDYSKPLTNMRKYLDAMDKAPYQAFRPKTPLRRVLAALKPKMLGLSAERTDGAHPYFVPVEHTAQARKHLGPDPLLCPEQMVLLEKDASKAREIARGWMKVYAQQPNYANNLLDLGYTEEDISKLSDKLVDAIVAWGSVEQITKRVKAHFDAGADHVAVQALPDSPRGVPTDQWKELAPALTALKGRAA